MVTLRTALGSAWYYLGWAATAKTNFRSWLAKVRATLSSAHGVERKIRADLVDARTVATTVRTLANSLKAELNKLLTVTTATCGALGGVLSGSSVQNLAEIADGASAAANITVTGAALGDFVLPPSFSLDVEGLVASGAVTAADTVTVRVENHTGGAVDLASATIRVRVLPQATFAAPAAITAATVTAADIAALAVATATADPSAIDTDVE